MRLLFVCTGNLCRSAVAEGLTRAWLARTPVAGPGRVDVLSAGTRAPVGEPMDRSSAEALTRLGGDPTNLRATALTPELATSADLVLTMTRDHRRAVLGMAPRGLRRTFTLLEAADLAGEADVRDLTRLPFDERAREFGLRLDAARARRSPADAGDIEDPIGQRTAVHHRVADEIDRALQPLLATLFPTPAPAAPPRVRTLRVGA